MVRNRHSLKLATAYRAPKRFARSSRSACAASARCECVAFHASPSSATVRVFAERDEDRVEAEPFRARGAAGDLAAQHTGADDLLAVRGERDELAHVLRAAVIDTVERGEDLLDVAILRPPRRQHAGRAAERRDLDPGVVREHPPVRPVPPRDRSAP